MASVKALPGWNSRWRSGFILLEVRLFGIYIFSLEYKIICGHPTAQMIFVWMSGQLGCLDGSRMSK